jgi:hypothetical protein
MLKQFNLSPKFCDDEKKKESLLRREEKSAEMTIHRKDFNF